MNTLFALLLAVTYPLVPNSSFTSPHHCTKSDKDFKEIRYSDVEICNRNVSSAKKDKVYSSYKIPAKDRTNYTVDHLVPLSLGGSNNVLNLWPQHKDISSAKLEGAVYNKLIKGEITYQDALNKVLDFKYRR